MNAGRWAMALGAATIVAGAPQVFAAGGSHTTVVHGTFDDRGFLTGFQGVDPAPPGVPGEAVFTGTSQVDGDHMHGSVVYTLWGKPNTGGWFDFHTVERFTGYVAGCGQGTMTYDVVGTSTPHGPTDPTGQTLEATWTIVAGSGGGGLSGVQSGGGKLQGTVGPTTANSGTIDGSVTCAAHPERRI